MTIPLPHPSIFLPPNADGSVNVNQQAIQDNLDALALNGDAFGGTTAQIRFGITSITFSASSYASVTNVQHGLGRTPAVVVATPYYDDVSGLTQDVFVTVSNLWTDTDFRLSAQADSGTGAKTGTIKVCWIAIG